MKKLFVEGENPHNLRGRRTFKLPFGTNQP